MVDRSEVSRSLAKAIAYKQCGKQADAEAWARRLVEQLECADILALRPLRRGGSPAPTPRFCWRCQQTTPRRRQRLIAIMAKDGDALQPVPAMPCAVHPL